VAKDLNKVMLTGHLGADPEMRYTAQGSAVTTFRVASNRSWKSTDGTQHDDTEWFRIVAWEKLAEICNQYLTRGTRVYVEGRLQTRKWQDQSGQDRYITEVVAQDMIILSSRSERGAAADAGEIAPPAQSDDDYSRRSAAAAPAGRAPAGGQRAAAPPRPTRNVPTPIENEEDLPF
jgi:single-strand DNA-binding protein